MVVCFALILVQLVNVQYRQAPALRSSPDNPRNFGTEHDNMRGDILAANGTVLAESGLAPKGSGSYKYVRIYPSATASLFAGIVGWDSIYYGTGGVEEEYNSYLSAQSQQPDSVWQLFTPPPPTTDNVILTVEPYLQQTAEQALADISPSVDPSGDRDGAVVVLDIHTGAVLAMYSNPTFDPNDLASTNLKSEELAGYVDFHVPDGEGFLPGYPIATFYRIFPGSTFKVVTTSAVYNLDPSLSNFNFPVAPCTAVLPDSNKMVCNDASTPALADPCGGTIAQMLPASCDPGYAMLGIALGADNLSREADLFGYNSVPPIDLPTSGLSRWVVASAFPSAADFGQDDLGLAGLAYSAFGQQDVQATALQQAMVAAGVADGGTVMTPHLLSTIDSSGGQVVKRYKPTVYKQALSSAAAQQVNQLMQSVATVGTAAGVFPRSLDAAVKTGTAQTGLPNTESDTDDWMIGFAPANNPQVAVAVVVPYQEFSTSGAEVAGPIVRTMLEAALNPPPGE